MSSPRQLLVLALLLVATPSARGQTTIQTLFGGGATLLDHQEASLSYHLISVDLKGHDVGFVSTSSNGADAGETDLQTTSQFVQTSASRFGEPVQVGLNANFFGTVGLPAGKAELNGLAMTAGQIVSPYNVNYGSIGFGPGGLVRFLSGPSPDLSGIETAVSGTYFLIADGMTITDGYDFPTATNARTVIAANPDRSRLFLFTVDASALGSPYAGVTYVDAASLLRSAVAELHGPGEVVDYALNLDGGGSSTLVVADPTARLVNVPKLFGTERSVGNNLGLFIRPIPEPSPLALLATGSLIVSLALGAGRRRRARGFVPGGTATHSRARSRCPIPRGERASARLRAAIQATPRVSS